MIQTTEIQNQLTKISRVFNIDELLNLTIGKAAIIDYYRQSSIGYKLLHSFADSIHLAMNSNGKFDPSGYYAQVKIVEQLKTSANWQDKEILELASGKGFNSLYLAKRHPQAYFTGLDLTPHHVATSQKKARNQHLSNLCFLQADFHNQNFKDNSFDLVFVVESLCHALDTHKVVESVFRMLKPHGIFVIIDGFRNTNLEDVSHDERIASILVEKTMAIEAGIHIETFCEMAQSVGFEISHLNDNSKLIMPNLLRFKDLYDVFFRFPALAKHLVNLLPPYLTRNSVAGALMPSVVEAGLLSNYTVCLTKPKQ